MEIGITEGQPTTGTKKTGKHTMWGPRYIAFSWFIPPISLGFIIPISKIHGGINQFRTGGAQIEGTT